VATSTVKSQNIYISNSFDLYRLDLEQCKYELVVIVDRQMSDITFLPDGTLMGINLSRELFEIDTITGQTTLLYLFPGLLFGALASSIDGLIYTTDRNGEFWSYDRTTGNAVNLGNVGFSNSGDLAFFNGELYMSTANDLIIKIDIGNPSNSSIVMTNAGSDGGAMYGIVTYALDCNDIRFFGIISGNYTILEVDLENLTTDTVCILDQLFSGAATTRDFKASDPVRVLDTLVTHPGCLEDNGTISIMAGGGIPPYEYSLNGSPLQNQNVFSNLLPGSYAIEIVDTRGCSTSIDITLEVQATDLVDTIHITNVTCNQTNGQIEILTNDVVAVQFSLDDISYQASGIFDQLDAGFYNVYVSNSYGCKEELTAEVLMVPAAIISDIIINPTSCGDPNGSVMILTENSNETGYSIDGTFFQGSNIFEDLAGGSFVLTIMDENGCRDDSLVVIPSSVALSVDNVIIINPVCEEKTGSASISISNNTGALGFNLDGQGFQFSSLFADINIGIHAWTATDEEGCKASGQFEIEQIPVLELIKISTVMADCNSSNGEVEFELINTSGKIEIQLNDEMYSETQISGLPAATYEVEISDDKGCSIDTFLIIASKPCGIYIPNVFSPNGDGVNDEFVIELSSVGVRLFEVFDRWGTIVFSISDTAAGQNEIKWNGIVSGKPLNPGVYVYVLELEETLNGKNRFTGDITLIK